MANLATNKMFFYRITWRDLTQKMSNLATYNIFFRHRFPVLFLLPRFTVQITEMFDLDKIQSSIRSSVASADPSWFYLFDDESFLSYYFLFAKPQILDIKRPFWDKESAIGMNLFIWSLKMFVKIEFLS